MFPVSFTHNQHSSILLLSFAWIVLVLELLFQVFIRPYNYAELLKGSQAYNPSTALYINRFHLCFEALALALVIPDFLPIFGFEPAINTVKATVYTSVGSWKQSLGFYIAGNFYIFSKHLRLFCLVRHKRNHYINAIYMDKVNGAKRTYIEDSSEIEVLSGNPFKEDQDTESRDTDNSIVS